MNKFLKIGMAALAFALASTVEARQGGGMNRGIWFVGEGQFSHDNSTTASVYETGRLPKRPFVDGTVIVIEAVATIGTVDDEGATMTIGCQYGSTDMLTAVVITEDGRLKIRAVGVVRSTGTSGTILWSIEVMAETTTQVNTISLNTYTLSLDTTADTVDFSIPDQNLGLSFDWTAAVAANTLDVEQMIVWTY